MATIVSTRILALQATSPRIVAVPLPTNVTVDLSNTSQALNNLPSYTRVSGVTALATQSTLANGGGYLTGFGSVSSQNSLAYGGGYLTGFGVLASQSTVNLASQITGSLANSNVSGLGALALLGSVALDGAYVVNNLAATRIGAGTIAAGVIYAGDVAASQITSGYIAAARINAGALEVGKLQSATSATMAANTTFGLGTRWDADSGGSGGYTGVVGRASSSSTFGGSFTQSATNGYGLIAAATGGSGAAAGFLGNWTAGTATRDNAAYLGTGAEAGYFEWNPSVTNPAPWWARAGSSSYGLKAGYSNTFRGTIGTSGYAGRFGAGAADADTRVVELANGSYAIEVPSGGGSTKLQGFACNNATPQAAYTLNAASTDLSTVVALCNQIRTALINNGICA
jgi:hypothetical protein